jgi:hypothetical protein
MGANAAKSTKSGPDFIGTSDGNAVHASQSKLKQSITNAGATSRGSTTNTTEAGEIFYMNEVFIRMLEL